jgi:hypothetical protein
MCVLMACYHDEDDTDDGGVLIETTRYYSESLVVG